MLTRRLSLTGGPNVVSARTISTFLDKQDLYQRLRLNGLLELERALGGLGDRVYKVSGRVKTAQSFVLKAERREMKRPLAEMTDLVGLRVVCLFRDDLEPAKAAIRNAFTILKEDDKAATRQDAAVFTYEDVQFVAKLRRWARSDPELCRLRFEIQLRTIAMDTWATISHMVAYKEDSPLPPDLGHELYATNAMLWVADRTFDSVHRYRSSAASMVASRIGDDEPLNRFSLATYIAQRFPDRHPISGGADHHDAVLTGCVLAGARTIGDVRVLLDVGLTRIAKRLSDGDNRTLGESGTRRPLPAWWVVREALRAASPMYAKYAGVAARQSHVQARSEALARMPFSPAAYAEVIRRLAQRLENEPCDATSLRITQEILAEMKIDVPSATEWFESLGGFCDCELLMNVDPHVGEFDD